MSNMSEADETSSEACAEIEDPGIGEIVIEFQSLLQL